MITEEKIESLTKKINILLEKNVKVKITDRTVRALLELIVTNEDEIETSIGKRIVNILSVWFGGELTEDLLKIDEIRELL